MSTVDNKVGLKSLSENVFKHQSISLKNKAVYTPASVTYVWAGADKISFGVNSHCATARLTD